MENNKLEKVVKTLRNLTTEFNHNIYAVGGCVRDILLGTEPKDIDVVVDFPEGEQKLLEYLVKRYPGRVKNVAENIKFGTNRFTLILEDGTEEVIDCAMTRTESYSKGSRKPGEVGYAGVNVDALRRDFTLNALYYSITSEGEILDPTGKGLEDLKKGLLRTPLDPAETFNEDSLRMMRAVRFKHQKGFTLSHEVEEGIKTSCSALTTTAKERISEEFLKILKSKTPVQGIIDLHNLGLLKIILPEFDNYWGMDQKSKFHNLSFTDHSLEVLRKVAEKSEEVELRLAALLHDIAKPTESGHQVKDDGRWTYIGHDVASKDLTEVICLERFKLSRVMTNRVAKLVGYHMIIKQMWDGSKLKAKDSKIRKVVRTLGDDLLDEMILIDADNTSHAPEFCLIGQVDQFMEKVRTLEIADYSKPLVNGKEVCDLLGIRQGKAVGLFLDVVNLWRDENPRLTKNDLVELISKRQNFTKELEQAIKDSAK